MAFTSEQLHNNYNWICNIFGYDTFEFTSIFSRGQWVKMSLHRQALSCMSSCTSCTKRSPDSKVHGANMGPIWVRQDPGGPHVGPMNSAIWVHTIAADGFLCHQDISSHNTDHGSQFVLFFCLFFVIDCWFQSHDSESMATTPQLSMSRVNNLDYNLIFVGDTAILIWPTLLTHLVLQQIWLPVAVDIIECYHSEKTNPPRTRNQRVTNLSTYTLDHSLLNSFPPGQNGCHVADNIFRCIFVNKKFVFWLKYHYSLFLRSNWQ